VVKHAQNLGLGDFVTFCNSNFPLFLLPVVTAFVDTRVLVFPFRKAHRPSRPVLEDALYSLSVVATQYLSKAKRLCA